MLISFEDFYVSCINISLNCLFKTDYHIKSIYHCRSKGIFKTQEITVKVGKIDLSKGK